MQRMKQTLENIKVLKKFVSNQQVRVLADGCRNREEREFFHDKIEEMAKTFNTMPQSYEQDGKGDEAIVYLHYFKGGADWFITEKDICDEQLQAYGLCDLGMGYPEMGYVDVVELGRCNVELDLHFTPKTLREVKANR